MSSLSKKKVLEWIFNDKISHEYKAILIGAL